ncbi:MAG: tetratricopeptide repeat protein [Wolbachia sp.]
MCKGVLLLKEGQEKRGKQIINQAANEGFPHAMYASSIIAFREVMEGKSISGVNCDQQKVIEEAVSYMVNSGNLFSPLSSFVIGMIALYDLGGFGSTIERISRKSWIVHFSDVLLNTKVSSFLAERIKNSGILSYMKPSSLNFSRPDNYISIMGEKRAIEDLKWMVECIEYELAKSMLLNAQDSLVLSESLLQRLSFSGFADAKYFYAIELLKGTFEDLSIEKSRLVHTLLCEAVDLGHLEAKILCGTLPFRRGFDFLKTNPKIGRHCFKNLTGYLNVEFNSDNPKESDFREKVATLVASEYLNKFSPYVVYDEQKAKDILKKNGCSYEIQNLEKRLKEREQKSQCVLNDLLDALRHMQKCLGKRSCEFEGKELADLLGELHVELKTSRTNIPRSEQLLSLVEETKRISSPSIEDILSLQKLYFPLKRAINDQEDSSFKGKILQLLEQVNLTCTMLHLDYQTSRGISIKSKSIRRPSNFEKSHMQSSVTSNIVRSSSASSGIFVPPSTPSPTRLKRVRIRSNSSPEITLPQANSTAFNDDVFFNTGLSIDNESAIVDNITPQFYYVDLFIHVNPKDGKYLGPIFNNAADLCEQGLYDKALENYEQILQERKDVLSYKHFSTVMVAHNVAVLSYALGNKDRSLEVFNEMLKELGSKSPHVEAIKSNIKIVEDGLRRVSFTKPSQGLEQVRSGSSGSNSQSMLAIDKYKESYSAGSSTSGFGSTIGTFSDRQSTNEESGAASLDSKSSKVSSGTKLKQSLSSLQRNVSKTSVSSKSVGRSSQLESISQSSSRASSATSSSSTTSMPKRTSTEKKKADDSRSSSLPSSSLRNSKTEEHKSSRGRGNRK